ncbi:MAG: hypothetical protein LBI54_02530 [Lachnospiraceae bacterium]|nr:hypothetical protein [Lachnospiraceae bacterium]
MKSIIPIILLLFLAFAGSVSLGVFAGGNPQNEQALLTALDILTGKTGPASPAEADVEAAGYYFVYNETRVELGQPAADIVAKLGPAKDFYVYPSCAFEGDEKTYVYNGFELVTYMRDANDTDRVYSLIFWDDSVATVEGLCIGDSYEEMVAAYGTEYEEIPSCYIYVQDGVALSFSTQDDIITSITYFIEDTREYGD